MNRIATCWAICLLIVFTSCQKEEGVETPDAVLLVKTVEKAGTDSVVTGYSYDANDRLLLITTTGKQGSTNLNGEVKIYRQPSGVITRTAEKAAYLSATGVDSIITAYTYNTGTNRYVSAIFTTISSGTSVRDSIVFDYDGSGRIIRDHHFQTITGVPFVVKYKQEYVYNPGGTIDSVKNFSQDNTTSVYTLDMILDYNYDAKKNPLVIGNDAVLLYQYPFYGINNALALNANYPTSPSMNYSQNTVFVYNMEDHPASSTTTKSTAVVSTTTYHYQ